LIMRQRLYDTMAKEENKKLSRKKCAAGIISALALSTVSTVVISRFGKYIENRYMQSTLASLIDALLLIAVIVLFGQGDKLRFTFRSFGKGLVVGGTMTAASLIMLTINTFKGITEIGTPRIGAINGLLYSAALFLSVGMTEELMYRGVIMNFVRETMGEGKKSMIISMIISSVMFGVVHLFNLAYTDDVIGTLCQVGYAMSLGFMLAAVYARSHNIWANVIIHFLFDLSLLIYGEVFKNVTVTVSSLAGEHSIVLISAAIFAAGIAVSMFLLRKKKIGECFENTPDAA
jgi:Predicted metal-dependent membrane protease